MAKRKGKSEHRIKNWRGDCDSRRPEDLASRKQSLSRRSVKLPPWRLAAAEQNLDDLPKTEGMVVSLFPGGAVVRCEGKQLLCGIVGTFRAPKDATALVVGDLVTVALASSRHATEQTETDKDRADGLILARRRRVSALARPQPRSRKRRNAHGTEVFEKIIAANMDSLLIVAATRQPPLRRGLIDRYFIIAERGELQAVLVINKIDLAPPDEALLDELRELQIDVHPCSALTGQGVDSLAAALAGKRSVLAGASGVGKSALINALIPGTGAAIGAVRAKDQRGRHTTASAAVHDLPDGGFIVDTPGVRELGIHLDTAQLHWYFPEFEQFAPDCRFRNCTHTHEPACAVRAAAEQGDILPRRYASYLRILETMEEN